MHLVAAGTPIAAQTAGDCKTATCDGAGNVASKAAPTDAPNDGNDCTADACDASGPTHAAVAPGTLCLGACGCPAPDCHVPTASDAACTAGLCDDAGACVAFSQVQCKIGGALYVCADGWSHPFQSIFWPGGQCLGSVADVAYCAPGAACDVYLSGTSKGTGVCL